VVNLNENENTLFYPGVFFFFFFWIAQDACC
jgi:hypothetical protein